MTQTDADRKVETWSRIMLRLILAPAFPFVILGASLWHLVQSMGSSVLETFGVEDDYNPG